VGVDGTLPGVEFLYRQLVLSADFLKAYHASAHSVDDYGFTPGYPAFVSGGRRSKSKAPPPTAMSIGAVAVGIAEIGDKALAKLPPALAAAMSTAPGVLAGGRGGAPASCNGQGG
jgi:hypothetical protein